MSTIAYYSYNILTGNYFNTMACIIFLDFGEGDSNYRIHYKIPSIWWAQRLNL